METGSQELTCFYGNQSSSYPTAVRGGRKKRGRKFQMKKINSGLPYWCDSSRSAVRMGTDMLFLPRIFSNNYPTNIKTSEMKRRLGTIQCVIPSFYLSFIYWRKAEADELNSTCVDFRLRTKFLQLLIQIFPQLFLSIFSTSAFFPSTKPTFNSLYVKILTAQN